VITQQQQADRIAQRSHICGTAGRPSFRSAATAFNRHAPVFLACRVDAPGGIETFDSEPGAAVGEVMNLIKAAASARGEPSSPRRRPR
jgi:hypothetical protein